MPKTKFQRGLHPGATWRKTDFQIHTPRDPGWKGPRFAGRTEPEKAERDRWAQEFVKACEQRRLTAIAITDHHEFCYVPVIRNAIQALKLDDKLWLFPGAEVTCNDAVQCLVLFDVASKPTDWERLFGGHLQEIKAPDCSGHESLPTGLCGKDIAPFVDSLQADKTISDISIILPHVGNEGAHKNILREGFHDRFKNLDVDGFFTGLGFKELKKVVLEKVFGAIPHYGTRRRGLLTTGDNRSSAFDLLGKNACWVRLGEPTAEALRQALLADEARIAYEEPTTPSQRVLELEVSSSLCGKGFRVSFNDGFTGLIGGRGSGKSAILQYLRFGLGRSTGDTQSDDRSENQRERQLIADTLAGGHVKVTLERDGVVEEWSRTGNNADIIDVSIVGVSNETLSVDAAQQRFRARAFSQKQLSTLVMDPEYAAEQVTGIAAAESVDKRRAAEAEIQRAKREIQRALHSTVELWLAEYQQKQEESSVADLSRRIDALNKRLSDSGVSESFQQILADAPRYAIADQLLVDATAALDSDIESIAGMQTSIPSIEMDAWEDSEVFDEFKTFRREYETLSAQLSGQLADATSTLKKLKSSLSATAKSFKKKHAEFEKQHSQAIRQQQAHRSLIDEQAKLNNELKQAEGRRRKAETLAKQLQGAERQLLTVRKGLLQRRVENRAILEEAAKSVSQMSGMALRATVATEVIPRSYVSAVALLCDNVRIHNLQQRCEERLEAIMGNDGWEEVVSRILSLLKRRIQMGQRSSGELGDDIAKQVQDATIGQMTAQQVQGVFTRVEESRVLEALIAIPDDFIRFEYLDRGQYIPFEQASPGQQAAALLTLLLNQEAGTLIIDQPEDDLDNRVIMNIVHLVQSTKRKRQLIFSTHNANFIVNGDADKIIVLAPAAPQSTADAKITVDLDGAIETEGMKKVITDTVEGGQRAFELRSRKYAFEE